MPKGKSFDHIITEAEQIERVWADNTALALGDLTLAKFQSLLTDLRAKRDRIDELRAQQTAAANDLNTQGAAVSDASTRARSGIRAVYGPDSTQYELAGGTRASERKRPVRKAKPDSTQ